MASRTRDIGVMSHHTRIAGFEIRIRNLVDLKKYWIWIRSIDPDFEYYM